jgi:hypothetical protein
MKILSDSAGGFKYDFCARYKKNEDEFEAAFNTA